VNLPKNVGVPFYQQDTLGLPFMMKSALSDRLHKYISMKIITLGYWSIKNERNREIYKDGRPNIRNWRSQLKEDLALVIHRANQKKVHSSRDWILL
jgi:hypothetical protein